jgi:hypothetical protein
MAASAITAGKKTVDRKLSFMLDIPSRFKAIEGGRAHG